jgi:hypothetical protein
MDDAIRAGEQQYQEHKTQHCLAPYYQAAAASKTTPLAEFARQKKLSVTDAAVVWNQQKGVSLPFQRFPTT